KHAKILDQIDGDVVAPACLQVEMHRLQKRRTGNLDIALLNDLAPQRLKHRLSAFHAAAGQLPARHISMADEENAIAGTVVDDTAHTQRHRPAQEKPQVEQTRAQARPPWRSKGGFRFRAFVSVEAHVLPLAVVRCPVCVISGQNTIYLSQMML